ncbi:MAG: DUF5062 family protein [Steroidobacteraceae bacterium]
MFQAALAAGVQYVERKAAIFEPTDSASEKALYVYRLLVHDKVIAPMPEEQVSEKTIRHRLATWYAHQLGMSCSVAITSDAADRSGTQRAIMSCSCSGDTAGEQVVPRRLRSPPAWHWR